MVVLGEFRPVERFVSDSNLAKPRHTILMDVSFLAIDNIVIRSIAACYFKVSDRTITSPYACGVNERLKNRFNRIATFVRVHKYVRCLRGSHGNRKLRLPRRQLAK